MSWRDNGDGTHTWEGADFYTRVNGQDCQVPGPCKILDRRLNQLVPVPGCTVTTERMRELEAGRVATP